MNAKTINSKRQHVVQSVRKILGDQFQNESGKLFYSSPSTLFNSRYIFMGFNPGGTPSKSECLIRENISQWRHIRENHFNCEQWGKDHKYPNTLQKRVRKLFSNLQINLDESFTSNLWFKRSPRDTELKLDNLEKEACVGVWKEFLAQSPARRIICNGLKTSRDFCGQIGAESLKPTIELPTKHPQVSVSFAVMQIQSETYKIVSLPHLSRFTVEGTEGLIPEIKRFFR